MEFVSNTPECRETFLFAPLDGGRIFQAPVNPFGVAWEHRTLVALIVTDRDNAVEILPREFIH